MSYVIPNDATHVALVTVVFETGEPDEYPVQFGSFAVCDSVARRLPAVASSGERRAVSASVTVRELLPLCATCGQRHDGCPEARKLMAEGCQ